MLQGGGNYVDVYSHRKGNDKSIYLPNKVGAWCQVGDLEQSGENFATGFRGFLVSNKWLCVRACVCVVSNDPKVLFSSSHLTCILHQGLSRMRDLVAD